MCGRTINGENEERFRVLIDVEQMRPGEDDSDLDGDYAEDFDEFRLDSGEDDGEENAFRSFRFDLCRDCAESYLRDPLARKLPGRLRLMDN
jgi:hypothetical protein